jgi:hypothetical protein
MNYLLKNHPMLSFEVEVVECEKHKTGNGLHFWNLELLKNNALISAYHWDHQNYQSLNYQQKDKFIITGRWSTQRKDRFQIIQSHLLSIHAANDDCYDGNEPQQLQLNF